MHQDGDAKSRSMKSAKMAMAAVEVPLEESGQTPNKPEVGMADEESVVAGTGTEEAIMQFLPICGEGNDQTRIGSAETTKMRKKKLEERTEQWREKARAIGKNASILAGGDGSRISRNGETTAAYGWGVYGIGEHSVEY